MTATKKVFIDTTDFYSFTVGTFLNIITLNVFDYMATHNGTTLGLQTISLQGIAKVEVIPASFDATANINKYSVVASTNAIQIGVDPAVVTTQALAINYIQGLLLIYNLIPLTYASTESLYTMNSYLSNGTKIGSTLQSTFDVLTAKIDALDQYQNPNLNGYYTHVLTRSLAAS